MLLVPYSAFSTWSCPVPKCLTSECWSEGYLSLKFLIISFFGEWNCSRSLEAAPPAFAKAMAGRQPPPLAGEFYSQTKLMLRLHTNPNLKGSLSISPERSRRESVEGLIIRDFRLRSER